MTDSPSTTPELSDKKAEPASNAKDSVHNTPNSKDPAASTIERVDAVNTNTTGGSKVLGVLAILVSLLALGGSGYTWYENNFKRFQQDSKIAVGVAEIGGQVTRIGDSVSRLQTQQNDVVSQEQLTTKLLESNTAVDMQLRDLKTEHGQQLRDIKAEQVTLLGAVDKINSDLQTGVNSYVIDEVSQLLKLANNSALFSGDANSAIKALQLADVQLKEMSDPRFSLVRRKINDEIGILNNIQQIDVESLTAQLQAIANRVPSLKLENERPALETIVLEVEASEEEKKTVKGVLKEFWAELVNVAAIQRIDQPPKPLLAPEQRYFLNQNLQLQLAKAELGVLQKREAVYTQSLGAATQWINDYFDLNDDNVKQVIAEITKLKSQPINVELPAVSGSYDALQTIKGGQ